MLVSSARIYVWTDGIGRRFLFKLCFVPRREIPYSFNERTVSTQISQNNNISHTTQATGVTAPKAPKAASRVVVTESKYKMKTKRAAAKRFRVTSNGKVVMRKPFKGHLLGHKSSNRKRRLSRFETAKRCDRNLLRKMLPYDGVKCLNK